MYPAGVPPPDDLELDIPAAMTIANLVTMPLGADGRVSVYNPFGGVDVLFDVAGYYPTVTDRRGRGSARPATERVCDGHHATARLGGRFGQLGAQDSTQLQLTSATVGSLPCCVRRGFVLNVTITGTSAPSYLTRIGVLGCRSAIQVLELSTMPPANNLPETRSIVRTPANGILNIFNAAGRDGTSSWISSAISTTSRTGRTRALRTSFTPSRAIDQRDLRSPFPAPRQPREWYPLLLG